MLTVVLGNTLENVPFNVIAIVDSPDLITFANMRRPYM